MRQVFQMSNAYQKHARSLLVAQAALVWTQAGKEAIANFIETGRLSGEVDVEPYDQNAVKQLVAITVG